MNTQIKKTIQLFKELRQAAQNGKSGTELRRIYEEYKKYAVSVESIYDLRNVVSILKKVRANTGKSKDLFILDHGCGGFSDALYLMSLGYKNVYGTDLGLKIEKSIPWIQNVLESCLGITEQRIFITDGRKLPFPDGMFDFSFSQHTIEHVGEDYVDSFYKEARRILKPDGIRSDTFPHRLNPYETHTKTWLYHYLPLPLTFWIYEKYGFDKEISKTYFCFKTRGYHYKKLSRYYEYYEDNTINKLLNYSDGVKYDGTKVMVTMRKWARVVMENRQILPFISPFIKLMSGCNTVAYVIKPMPLKQ